MAKGSILSYSTLNELQTQTQKHHNYQQGKKEVVDINLSKETSISIKWYQGKELNLQFYQYYICEQIEETICNRIANLA